MKNSIIKRLDKEDLKECVHDHTEVCKCIREPRGENGLEGFEINETYIFIEHNNIHRVYLVYLDIKYYETCGKNTFNKFFKKI